MIVLASDTSTKSLSVAITDDGKTIFSETISTGSVHSRDHMPLIEKALCETSLEYKDIDLMACTIGPGSYTGIRINVASLKAIAYAADKRVIGVSTLFALAYPYKDLNVIVCPLLDARNRRVFSSVYSGAEILAQEGNYTFDEILEHIVTSVFAFSADNGNRNLPERILFCGDAALKLREDEISDVFRQRINAIDPGISFEYVSSVPEGSDIASAGLEMFLAGCETDPFLLNAEYISPSQAERMKSFRDDRIIVRKAFAEDLDFIEKIENDSFKTPWSRKSIENDLLINENSSYLVAETKGEIVGYIGFHMIFEDAQITNLAVSVSLRRKGAGRVLVRKACETARRSGCTKMFLEVRASNVAAKSLYISEGFQSVGARRGYYEDNGETAIIMLKNL